MKKIICVLALTLVLPWVAVQVVASDDKKAEAPNKITVVSPETVRPPTTQSTFGIGQSDNFGLWWQVISSGATDGSSANFGLRATVGQTATGYGESESFGLSHGFWQEFEGGGGGCCMGEIRGNVDNDPGDVIDISDLVFLVDYMFTGGPAPTCWEEANIDGSGDGPPDGSEDIDISDLVYLVDFMFNGGPAPLPCP